MTAEIRWAPRVPRRQIRRLYETDARGIVDEDLIDEVGIALYARCESILAVTEAHRGRITCHACHAVFDVAGMGHWRDREAPLTCDACGWQTTWNAYLRSFQGKRLHAGSAERVFIEFVRRYPAARSPRQRMLAIDWLLHEFHEHYQFGLTRPAAANVIQGDVKQVMALLDGLASEGNESSFRWREKARSSVFARYLGRASVEAPPRPRTGEGAGG